MASAVHNIDIAAVFDEFASLLEISDENPFRIRAYRNASRIIQDLPREVSAMVRAGEDLTSLPGIGKDLAAKIQEIVETGKLRALGELKAKLPPALTALLRIPSLGPKRVKAVYDQLGVESVEALAEAARAGKIRTLPGFGAKTEERILRAIEARQDQSGRVLRAAIEPHARSLVEYLRAIPGVKEAIVGGSFRRGNETVGDLDFLVTARDPQLVMDRFVDYPGVAEVLSHGPTRSTVMLNANIQVDVRAVAEEAYGAALHYFTGSKAHNIAIRKLGQERGLKINEYGVFRGNKRIAGDTEESVFASVGLPFIPPEMREARGEIELARSGRLPKLVEARDIRGELHAHTKATDGANTVREMAEAARARGLEYIAITDHSKRLKVANGMDAARLLKQIDQIDKLNEQIEGITILKGIECDILWDGRLDLPDEVLARLDVVVGAVHSKFGLPEKEQTERILRAMDNKYFSILAHPTGRLIQEREAYAVDMQRIIRHAKQRGCFLEVNSQPVRLDLMDVYIQAAKAEGVLMAIDTDAHSTQQFDNLRFGISMAKRGWLEKKDVLNARPLAKLLDLLRKARGSSRLAA